MNIHRARRALIATTLALTGLLTLFGASPAAAHSGEQSYVYLEIFDDGIVGRVEYPIDDLNDVLGLAIPETEDEIVAAMEANADAIIAYTREHLAIGPGPGETWPVEFEPEFEALEIARGSYGIVHFEVTETLEPPPRTFRLAYDGIIESDSDKDAFLLIATDWDSGTFNNEGDEFLRYTSDSNDQIVELDDTSWWKGFSGTIDLGVEHIRIGSDHILFVFALVLPAALVFRREPGEDAPDWHPAPSFGSSLWRVIKIVSMFTIAHSITLALGGLGVIEISPRIVETIIAVSIAIAALHNIRPIWPNREWAMAFGFGLFHGFGFAGLLGDLGLDRSNRVQSLLGFNIGVELGQATIILMIFPMLYIVRRTPFYRIAMVVGSIALALVALLWGYERAFDQDINVSDVVDPVLRWPRSALLIAALYLGAIAIWRATRSRGELRPVATGTAVSPDIPEDARELVDA